MALFKSRKGNDDPLAATAPSESVEAVRKRARHRLMGAALLVLAGVIGFPLLFDTQPRPVAVDIPIEIPDKNKARSVAIVVAPPGRAAAEAPAVKAAPVVAPKPPEKMLKPTDAPVKLAEPKDTVVAAKVAEKAGEKSTDKASDKASDKAAAKPSDAAKAQALLDGSSGDKPAPAESRFVVQVGAFADAALAKEARAKLERAGLKTYTTVVETKDGQRTRVRVGPFVDKADADSAASKIKALDLPAAILVL